jgi:hypothetical protein
MTWPTIFISCSMSARLRLLMPAPSAVAMMGRSASRTDRRVRISLFRNGRIAASAGELREKERQIHGEKAVHQLGGEALPEPGTTDHKLASQADTSHTTIHRVRVIENEAPPEVKDALAKGETRAQEGCNREGAGEGTADSRRKREGYPTWWRTSL